MPEPLPEYTWKVTLRKGGKPLKIRAAYITEGVATGVTASGQPAPHPASPLVLKDAGHKAVFAAPPDQVVSVVRGGPAGPCERRIVFVAAGDLNMTPNQIRDEQARLQKEAGRSVKVVLLPPGSLHKELADAVHDAELKYATRNGGV